MGLAFGGHNERGVVPRVDLSSCFNLLSSSETGRLGSGQFGCVMKGEWLDGTKKVPVALKTLNKGTSPENMVKFLQEAAITAQFKHPNVINLYGVVAAEKEPVRRGDEGGRGTEEGEREERRGREGKEGREWRGKREEGGGEGGEDGEWGGGREERREGGGTEEGGREEGREGGRRGWRMGRREGGRGEGGQRREGGRREGGRRGGREERREEGGGTEEGGREEGREGERGEGERRGGRRGERRGGREGGEDGEWGGGRKERGEEGGRRLCTDSLNFIFMSSWLTSGSISNVCLIATIFQVSNEFQLLVVCFVCCCLHVLGSGSRAG